MRHTVAAASLVLASMAAMGGEGSVIDATTADGHAVRLLPNGRWEYRDAERQAEAARVAETYPENHLRPKDAQGGWFGTRYIMPGDPDYNRGSLNPKTR
ncbi:hypothetical protein [Cognatazoarcus halotolerans]|uniref:hypothetical protein n=1 Tax=Cognatazoarcus halotolerans TaxID=2686016 RepID=UPI001357BE90|nr:hypothetical protein [Cognatazoarcus halotolerans]MBX3678696.1 hypothetical protein [Rhodocyclaceae bacterium]MCB1899485.1 hypothetical protein [Rhodocyclaceae bacterium]MCP5309423.1 hypothetical protein [Zoogloeaceae bacterium]